MDFAPEPVRDAFPPPPSRPAQASTAPNDRNGRSFNDHLDDVSEPRERSPQNEARNEPAPVDARAARSEDAETAEGDINADTALLGGPLAPAPPPMAAPVAVQIAASQPTPPTQAQPQDTNAPIAPLHALPNPPRSAPDSALPGTSAKPANVAAAEPVEASAPAAAKSADADVKSSAPKTAPTDTAPQAQPPAQPTDDAMLSAAQQATAQQIATADLPQAVQQAIAATIAPALQTNTQQTTRTTAKGPTQAIDAKTAPDARDGKAEAPVTHAKAQAQAKTSNGNGPSIDILPAPQTQSSAPDASQVAESTAISTTASQASTHVQQASAETGTQRAAPAAAQVGREIIRRFNGGTTNFELRLDPAELGRVEIRMEVTRDNRVTAVVTADNPQALTELARHARELEQQLQSAGLQLSDAGLSFDLRQGAQDERDAQNANASSRNNGGESTAANEQQPAPVARPIGYEQWRGVRVDMMV